MLKITTHNENPEFVRVSLCGRFTGEYVSEIQKVLSGDGAGSNKFVLDLAEVNFVDRTAMLFLYEVKSRNVDILNIPSYVTRWIEQEGRTGCHSEHVQD